MVVLLMFEVADTSGCVVRLQGGIFPDRRRFELPGSYSLQLQPLGAKV